MGASATPPKFDKNKDLIKGELTMVFLNDSVFAYAKKDDFKFTPSQIDVASKLSGNFNDKMGGKIDWSLSVEAFVSKTKGHMSYDQLEHIAASGKAVTFELARVTVSENANGERSITKGDVLRKGRVTVGDLSRSSQNGEYETFNCTLNGSGPLLTSSGKEVGSSEALTEVGITIV